MAGPRPSLVPRCPEDLMKLAPDTGAGGGPEFERDPYRDAVEAYTNMVGAFKQAFEQNPAKKWTARETEKLAKKAGVILPEGYVFTRVGAHTNDEGEHTNDDGGHDNNENQDANPRVVLVREGTEGKYVDMLVISASGGNVDITSLKNVPTQNSAESDESPGDSRFPQQDNASDPVDYVFVHIQTQDGNNQVWIGEKQSGESQISIPSQRASLWVATSVLARTLDLKDLAKLEERPWRRSVETEEITDPDALANYVTTIDTIANLAATIHKNSQGESWRAGAVLKDLQLQQTFSEFLGDNPEDWLVTRVEGVVRQSNEGDDGETIEGDREDSALKKVSLQLDFNRGGGWTYEEQPLDVSAKQATRWLRFTNSNTGESVTLAVSPGDGLVIRHRPEE